MKLVLVFFCVCVQNSLFRISLLFYYLAITISNSLRNFWQTPNIWQMYKKLQFENSLVIHFVLSTTQYQHFVYMKDSVVVVFVYLPDNHNFILQFNA